MTELLFYIDRALTASEVKELSTPIVVEALRSRIVKNEAEAHKVLTDDIGAKYREKDGHYHCYGPYLSFTCAETSACLDGDFTKEQLLAIAELMVVKRPWPEEHKALYPRWTCGKCKQWHHAPWVLCDCDRAWS